MEYDFSEVLVYLYDSQTHIRRDVRAALTDYGFGMVQDFRTYEEFLDKMEAQEHPDLIICDADSDGGEAVNLIRRIRHHEFGDNPFLGCVMTTWDATPDKVKLITNAGVDALLSKPTSPKTLMERIYGLVSKRKPFIVTSEYIGPDRRKDPGRATNIQRFSVPNTLFLRASGQEVPDLGSDINQCWTQLMKERQSRNAFELVFLVDLLIPVLSTRDIDGQTMAYLKRLVEICGDMAKRLRVAQRTQAADLVKRIMLVAKTIHTDPESASDKNINLLKPLSLAIHKAMHPDVHEEELAAEISGALENYSKRKTKAS